MEEKDSWGLTEEEKRERVRKLNQEKDKKGATRGGRSSGQGVKLLYIRDYLYAHATKEHPKNARHIKDEQPTLEELKEWHSKSGLPMKKFFNTSGKLYRELELKDKLPTMSDEEMLNLLATDGMLVKRPIAVLENKVLVGFKEAEWEENLK